jgi:putative transposase
LAEGIACGLHRIQRLMQLQALRARPRRRRLPPDRSERQAAAVAANVLDRRCQASAPNRKWIADFTYIWTAEGWLYVAAVIDLFSRRVVGWSMSATMTAQLVADALVSGNVWDNAAMESFFSSLKTERTARKTYRSRDQPGKPKNVDPPAFRGFFPLFHHP